MMHGIFYNEAILDLSLKPQTPLLIKSGQPTEIDPTLPDMQFVRTRRPDTGEEVIYIPGSSFRGVLRSYAERLVRSIQEQAACDPTRQSRKDAEERIGSVRILCLSEEELKSKTEKKIDKLNGDEAYRFSCYTCRIFGNTGLAARVRVADFYPDGTLNTEVRYGVAIDRVTGAVAHGPFQLEIVTAGGFVGTILLRNFTLGQLGLIAAALLDMADGLVPMGHAKSRGLGRVNIEFRKATFRYLKDPGKMLLGIEALVNDTMRQRYSLPSKENAWIEVEREAQQKGAFFMIEMERNKARELLESAALRWVEEVEKHRES